MTTPKPCPFCGAKAEAFPTSSDGTINYLIQHKNGCFQLGAMFLPHSLLDAWNRRYTDYVLRPEPLQPLKSYTDAVAAQGCKVTKEVKE